MDCRSCFLVSWFALACLVAVGCTTPLPLLEIDAGGRADVPGLDAPAPEIDAPVPPGTDAPRTDAPLPGADAPSAIDAPGAVGAACSAAVPCVGGHCVDGFCCDTACGGSCMACSGALTGAANGTCAPVTAGTDPGDDCSIAPIGTCGATGECDGSGACALATVGSPCGSAICVSQDEASQPICDAAGSCTSGLPTSCGAYRCRSGRCNTMCMGGIDCASGADCNAGVCMGDRRLGDTCGRDSKYESTHCVDNRCCDTACTGLCRSCESLHTGSPDGTCAPIMCSDPDNECSTMTAPSCVAGVCGPTVGC